MLKLELLKVQSNWKHCGFDSNAAAISKGYGIVGESKFGREY